MLPVYRTFGILLLSGAALLPAPAMAADVPPAVAAFLANLERQTEMKASYAAMAPDASGAVTLTQLALTRAAAGGQPEMKLTSETVTLSGLAADGQSGFTIGKASFTGNRFAVTGKELSFTAATPSLMAGGWHIHVPSSSPTAQEQLLASGIFADTLSLGKISFELAGLTFSIDGVEGRWSGDAGTGAGSSSWKGANLAIPEASMPLFDPVGLARQLGYAGVNLDFEASNELRVAGQDLGFSFTGMLAGKDIARLTVSASADGIPVEAYLDMLKPAGGAALPEEVQKRAQSARFNGASLRFEDASITGKLLPIYAAAAGVDQKTFIAAIPLQIQLALLRYQNEAFTKQVVDAVTRFLAAPKSLTLTAKPAAPVTLSNLENADTAKPGAILDVLGLAVTAND